MKSTRACGRTALPLGSADSTAGAGGGIKSAPATPPGVRQHAAPPQRKDAPPGVEQRRRRAAIPLHVAADLASPITARFGLAKLVFEQTQTAAPPLPAVPEIAV